MIDNQSANSNVEFVLTVSEALPLEGVAGQSTSVVRVPASPEKESEDLRE